jgi:hypothetical protein
MQAHAALQQRLASLEAQKGAMSAHYNLESVSLYHMSTYLMNQHVCLVALERRLSSHGISEEAGNGEEVLVRLPEEIDTIATSGLRAFSDLESQDARDCFESEVSNYEPGNGFDIDVALADFGSSLVLPMANLSPANFISDLMRSNLYAVTTSSLGAKPSLMRSQS